MFRINARIQGIAATSLLCIMTLAACGDSGKSNVDLLKEGAANMKTVKSYHLAATIEQAGQAGTLTGDFDLANNNFRIDADFAGQKYSAIKIGDKGWASMDGGANYTETSDTASLSEGFDSITKTFDNFKPEEVDKVKDSIKDGTPATEKMDGVDTKHMTVPAADFDKMGAAEGTGASEGTVDMWIGPDSKPLIRQIKMDGTQDGQPVKVTLTWTKLDETVDIKAPNQ